MKLTHYIIKTSKGTFDAHSTTEIGAKKLYQEKYGWDLMKISNNGESLEKSPKIY